MQLAINIQQQNLYKTLTGFKIRITIVERKKYYLGYTSMKKCYFDGDRY